MSGVARAGAEDDRRSVSDRPLDRTSDRLSGSDGDGERDPGLDPGDEPGRAPASGPRRFARLRPGDRVVVIAPSGPVDPDRLEAGRAVLSGLGLEVTVAPHALDRTGLAGPAREGWQRLAGGDADRAADLRAAWCDPGVRAVLCARGGYGATRLLGLLDWDAMAAAGRGTAPKILHGSSDVTALHVAFGARLGVTTSFGPMPAGEVFAGGRGEDRDRSLEHFRKVLFAPDAGDAPQTSGGAAHGAEEGPRRPAAGRGSGEVTGTRALRPGRAEGLLTGGTLSLLTALLGTPDHPPPAAGRIVFLEDVSEAPYRIDRMLTQLLRSGWLDGAAGIALGTWTGCGDPAEVEAVLAGRLAPLGVPILAGLPAGHGPCQLTLELGAPHRLDTGALTLAAAPQGGVR
ncbi:S66 peptidase family protein [Actinomadura rugatobispora]|uniref:LD-carboxypeptidase n=1 Tax=Actinomadura rugatobispora TaxID=1994 RepID=A0ABW1A3G2_9ACTN